MPEDIIGRGWAYPLRIDPQGGIAITSERDEIEQAILIILGTSIGRRLCVHIWLSAARVGVAPNNSQTAAEARCSRHWGCRSRA
jgi:hypothetical protein